MAPANAVYPTDDRSNSSSSPTTVVAATTVDLKLQQQTHSISARSKAWIFRGGLALLLVALVAVGLGVGLGVGLSRARDDSGSSALQGASPSPQQDDTHRAAPELRLDPRLPTHYIAATAENWAYMPAGGNACEDAALARVQAPVHAAAALEAGSSFLKARYRAYTDGTFTAQMAHPDMDAYLGILGPLIRAEAGSVVQVVFRNYLPFPVNMEPSGGSDWLDNKPGLLPPVQPNETTIYKWQVPDLAATYTLAAGMQNSRLYLYRSSVNPTAHDNLGLVGPIVVTAKGQANPDGSTRGIDRDIVTMFHVVEETSSAFAAENALDAQSDAEAATRMTINGYSFCNLPRLEVVQGQRVRWHVASLGSELAIHNFHWHGNTFLYNGHRVDHINLLGSNTASLDMSNDSPGTWLFHCHVNAHLDNGMQVTYTVTPSPTPITASPLTGETRTYYVQAEEVMWNYAPTGGLQCSGMKEPFDEKAGTYLGDPDDAAKRVGSVYEKAIYFQFTDATFKTRIQRPATSDYMGILGPVLRANVGDTIKVVFRNALRYHVSVHPHGVLYSKANEGAPYNDNSTEKGDDYVAPNTTYMYTWTVPERAGPGPADPSSIVWLYHSHTDETADTYAGLVGAMVVNREGAAGSIPATANDTVGARLASDVDEEAFLFFSVMDEYSSRYAFDNIKWALGPALWDTEAALQELGNDDQFLESSLKHSINGFMFCNMPRPSFKAYQRIRFHVLALGSQADVHSPTIGVGGSFLTLGQHASSMVQLPGGMTSTDVVFTDPGTFEVACRVTDHIEAGMVALYNVTAPAGASVTNLTRTSGVTRQFNIAAEQVLWDYTPNGYMQCTTEDLSGTASRLVTAGLDHIGPKRAKAQFVQYTDGRWATRTTRPSYLGIQGPVIAAEVGDVVEVVLKNRLNFTINFAPDGGLISLHNVTAGKAVTPGQTFTYRFLVPEQAGPLAGDLSTVALHYVSDVDMPGHTAAGLFGLIIIAAPGGLQDDGLTPKDADLLLPLHFQVFNENASPLYEEQVQEVEAGERAALSEDDSMMASINGFMYCNMPVPVVHQGALLRVVFSVFGSEESMVSPRIMGQSLIVPDGALQSGQLVAGLTSVQNVAVDTPGTWLILDDVHEHLDGGMVAQIIVQAAEGAHGDQDPVGSPISISGSGGRKILRRG